MSTRSGKRIHNSLLENTTPTEPEIVVKSERKTRSKRVKDNLNELSVSLFKSKKRNNYVSYPTDDELLKDETTKYDGEIIKPSRALRKTALKEQNPSEAIENLELQTNAKNLIRKSRRGKKKDDEELTENNENVPDTESTKSKKSKKKKRQDSVDDNPPPTEEATAKKTKKKKKGKKASSMIVEDIPQNDKSKNNNLNKSNMSIDSFHSAAGSPVQLYDHVEHGQVTKDENVLCNSSTKVYKKTSNINTCDKNNVHTNMSVETNEEWNTEQDSKKKRQSLSNHKTLGKCFVAITRDNLENNQENLMNVHNLSNGQIKRRKSKSRDATFNNSNISTHVDVEMVGDSSLNVSNTKLRNRRSSVKEVQDLILSVNTENNSLVVNGTKNDDNFDRRLRRRSSIVTDTTFDKSNSSVPQEINDKGLGKELNVFNISNKQLKKRKSVLKDNTFDKSDSSITKYCDKYELNISSKELKARKSIIKDTTFDKSVASITNNLEKATEESNRTLRRSTSYVKDSTFDKPEEAINVTFEKETEYTEKVFKKDSTFDKSNSKCINTSYEKNIVTTKGKGKKSIGYTTYDQSDTTFEKDSSTTFDAFKKGAMTRKSSMRDDTCDKSDTYIASFTKDDFEKDNNIASSSATKRRSIRCNTFDKTDVITENGNISYDETSNSENKPKRKSLRTPSKSSEIQIKLNTTFDKENIEDKKEKENANQKLSLISSDNSSVSDKSDISRISITSDDTTEHVENIVNTTPLLIESSMDDSHNSLMKKDSPKPQTPLKREGTFTKDVPELQTENLLETPTKRNSTVPTAGCTPYHIAKSSQKKTVLNVTRSIEKGACASLDPAPRMTRVMFCSPVDNPVMATQEKRKIIKSNLKGSNKSFLFEESASASRPGRKRSYTQSDADDARVKRTRLTEDLQQSVDRLSRPRTTSATAKLSVTTPKRTTPSKAKPDVRPTRTKLPNFAAVHQKQFDKMESLNECQERRAKRAKQLLTPTAPPGLLDRISPKNNPESPKGKELAKPKEKTDTPTKKLPTLESLRPGFTRFGFKLNMDVNPFSIPSKTEKPKEKPVVKPSEVPSRPAILPSLVGATSVRRETAKLAVMREKSFTGKRSVNRNETRTIIKGVRTNRRFELQMKLRNIE